MAKTVLPAEAHAKISCRLVPDQTPADIVQKLEKWVAANTPAGIRFEVESHHGGLPFIADKDARAVRSARAALQDVWGVEAVFTRGGGSIPIVASFKDVLGVDSVLMGFGLDDDRLHSPNEKFALENFYKGIEASAALFTRLGKP